jgi:probable rRNA maturation factor
MTTDRTPSALRVEIVDGRGRAIRVPGLARWLAATAPRSARGAVTVALVSDARMRRLNHTFRHVDRVTDVLSFPAGEADPGPPPAAPALGDVVIATGVAARQARALGHAVSTEYCVLALHGLLHLLGHDHETDQGEMAAIERRLRRKGGLPTGLIERERRR